MNAVLLERQFVSATDRLTLTIFLAVLVHALVILGVGFTYDRPDPVRKSLEIALVDEPTRAAPEQADFLAQSNQIGSGSSEKKAIPKVAEIPIAGETEPVPEVKPEAKPKEKERVAKKNPAPVISRKSAPMKTEAVVKAEPAETVEAEQPELTAAGLHAQIAALSAQVAEVNEQIAKRPRIKFINSVNAQKYKAAAYEKSWQDKVERIGNLNYPDEARRKHLSGSLLLAVGVRSDGTIYKIEVRRSSGHKALDDGAIRIARLAAPFAAFPMELAMEADILVITRTWKFSDDSHVTTSR